MQRTFKILTLEREDEDGDIFKKTLEIKLPKAGVMIGPEFKTELGRPQKPALARMGNDVIAVANIPDNMLHLYPAIGFRATKFTTANDDCRNIYEITLYWIGLCAMPNLDKSILPINQQNYGEAEK